MKRLVAIVRIIIIAIGLVSKTMEASAPSIDQKAVAPARQISVMDRLFKFSTVKNYLTQPKSEQKFVMPIMKYDNEKESLVMSTRKDPFLNVQEYSLSLDKKILFINKIKSTVLSRAAKEIVPMAKRFVSEVSTTHIISTQSGQQLISFKDVIMHKMSPDQTMILIAQAVSNKKPTPKLQKIQKVVHTMKKIIQEPEEDVEEEDVQEEEASKKILQYNVFDIASQSVKTFDMVRTINFSPDNKLLIQYDTQLVEKIDIKKTYSTSVFRKLMSYLMPKFFSSETESEFLSSQDRELLLRSRYDLPSQTLSIIPMPGESEDWPQVTSYNFSPNEQFLLANTTFSRINRLNKFLENLIDKNHVRFLNMKSGEQLKKFVNVISYEFGPINQVPSRLLIFNINADTKKPHYQLIDEKGQVVKTFENAASVYFDFSGNLVVIDQNNNITLLDATKGITFEEKKRQQTIEGEYQQKEKEQQNIFEGLPEELQEMLKKAPQESSFDAEKRRIFEEKKLSELRTEELQKDLEEESRRRQYKEKIQQEFLYPNLQQTHRKLLQQQKENEEQMWGKQPEIKQDANMAAYEDFFQRYQAKETEVRQKEEAQMLEKPKVSEQKKEETAILSEEKPTLSEEEIKELKEDYKRSTAPAQGVTLEKYLELYKEKKAESLKQRKENQEKEVQQSVKVQKREEEIRQNVPMPQVLPKMSPQQPERVQVIQELMDEYAKVQTELPQGINDPEDMNKSIEINKKLESIVTKIIDNFVQSSNNERLALFSTYNNYHQNFSEEQKRKFSQLFFGSPNGSLGTKEETYSIYSSDYTYGAQRFKNKREIKLWMETDGKISSTVTPNKPKEFSNIIGFRFITTVSGDVYLFFVDQNYNMGILDVRGILSKLQKSQELPKIQEPLVLQPAQEPQKLPEAQKQPENVQMTMEGLKERNPEKELPKIQEPLVLQSAQELQKLPEAQKQQENIQTTMQDPMNAFATVHKELPQGLESLEDIDKTAEINAQLEQIVAKIADELRVGTEKEQSDFLERYNKFTGIEKLKFSKLFFASKGASFGTNKQTYTIYSKDVTYRADRVSNERGIELWVVPRSGQGWLSVGKIVPNEPKEFSNIIGFRFMTGKPLYSLFFVDQNYDIGVINVPTEIDKLEKEKQA